MQGVLKCFLHDSVVCCMQKVAIPRGRGLGGSSSINFMVYTRGSRHDYDNWADNGCPGWGYADVLPYFLKAEDNANQEFVKTGEASNNPCSGWFYLLHLLSLCGSGHSLSLLLVKNIVRNVCTDCFFLDSESIIMLISFLKKTLSFWLLRKFRFISVPMNSKPKYFKKIHHLSCNCTIIVGVLFWKLFLVGVRW